LIKLELGVWFDQSGAGQVSDSSTSTVYIQACLDRLAQGDDAARGELLECACGRLRNLARKMLRNYPGVHRWEETDDVLQNAVLRLHRTMQGIEVKTTRDFFRVAALNIRRELLDLARHYYGPQGLGARHLSQAGETQSDNPVLDNAREGLSTEPGRLAAWTEFHAQAEALGPEEKEVFDLLWYQELSQAEAAALLDVSERTIKRRWQTARLQLHDALKGQIPE
jgi:RNA polymerase sigma-70 factor (ECF subfamily)